MTPQLIEELRATPDGGVVVDAFERHHVTVSVRGRPTEVRLTRVQGTWLASAATLDGPTLGVNRSPFLAVRMALEPLGGELVEVLAALRGFETGASPAQLELWPNR